MSVAQRFVSSIRPGLRLWLGLSALAVAFVVVGAAQAISASSWKIEPTPNPTDPSAQNLHTLDGVSCTSAAACWAVGHTGFIRNLETTIVESWNGSSWNVQPVPTPSGATGRYAKSVLNGISCTSATSCMAVGYQGSGNSQSLLAESWNGVNWTVKPMAYPGGRYSFLSGVSCASANACAAVGVTFSSPFSLSKALVEFWNGRTWRVTRVPQPGSDSDLQQVSCTSAQMCVAVGSWHSSNGSSGAPLAELWNGHRWTATSLPKPRGAKFFPDLQGVSCTSAKACVAVGYGPTAEFWNGRKWSAQQLPKPSGVNNANLGGVSCTSAKACVAVGGGPTAEFWNGRKWSAQQLPKPSGVKSADLADVSCTSAKGCVAVGGSGGSPTSFDSATLAEHYLG
jgi:hypothetical protein